MKTLKLSNNGIYLIRESIIFLSLSLLILVIGYTHSLIQYRILLIGAGLLTLIAMYWFVIGQKGRLPLRLPVMIWIGVYLISCLNSIDPRRSFGQMLIMSTSFVLFYAAHNLIRHKWPQDLFAKGFLFVGGLLTLSGILNAFRWYQSWLAIHPQEWLPSLTYRPATANVLAPFMTLTALLCLYYAYQSKNRTKIVLLFFTASASLFILFLTSSRGGWLGALAGLIFLIFCFVYKEKNKLIYLYHTLKTKRVWFVLVLVISAVIITLTGIILFNQAVHPTHGSILNARKLFWEVAIKTFLANPILGQGPFTYATAFMANQSIPPDHIWTHAHSSLMNLLAEMGLLGFLALSYLAIRFFRLFIPGVKQAFTVKQSNLIIPAAAFLITYLTHSLFDSLHMEPAIIWSLAILLGTSLPNQVSNKKTTNIKPWWILLPVIFSWYGIWLITPYHQGIQLANQNQWAAADEKLTLAIKRDPSSSITHQQIALVSVVLAEQDQSRSLQTAISQLEIATQTEPSWALNYANLASLYLSDNNLEKAYQNALSAKKLAPHAARYQIIYADIAEKRNQPELAFAAYQTALDLENTWADADFWHKNPLRQQARDAWQQANPVQTISLAEAERTLAENNQSRWAYNQLAALYLQDMRVAEAETLLKTAELSYTSRPLEAIETQWLLAEVSAQQNQFAPAVQLGSQALFNYQWDGVFGPGSFGLLQYAPRVFRSPAMGLEIVPQMIDMPVPQVWVERGKRVSEWEGLAQ